MVHTNENRSATMITRARRNTLGDLLTRTTAKSPDKLAFTYKHRKVTYQELDNLVNQTANGLAQKGIKQGERIAILSKNSLDFVIVMFAAARMGAVFIPINYMLKEKDIAYILDHAEVTAVFAAEEYMDTLDQAGKQKGIHHRIVLETAEQKNDWTTLAAIQRNQDTQPPKVNIMDDDLAHVLYTSGTESAPKGVMLSHKSIISEYVSCIVDGKMEGRDVLVHALPFYHSAQLHVFLGPSIYLGASGIILDEANPAIIMDTIEKSQATQLFAP